MKNLSLLINKSLSWKKILSKRLVLENSHSSHLEEYSLSDISDVPTSV